MIQPGALPPESIAHQAVDTVLEFLGVSNGLPPVPVSVGHWNNVVRWVAGKNDIYGDCTCCGAANIAILAMAATGQELIVHDSEVLELWSRITGFDFDNDDPPGNGVRLLDVIGWWFAYGLPRHPELKPIGWCRLAPDQIALGVYLFGAVYTRVMLPLRRDDWDFSDDSVADHIAGTGSHCVSVVGAYSWGYTLVTWGQIKNVSRAWWNKYAGNESYGILLPQWIGPNGRSPNGFTLSDLQGDASKIGLG